MVKYKRIQFRESISAVIFNSPGDKETDTEVDMGPQGYPPQRNEPTYVYLPHS